MRNVAGLCHAGLSYRGARVCARRLCQSTVWRCTESDGRAHYTTSRRKRGQDLPGGDREVSVVSGNRWPRPARHARAGRRPRPRRRPLPAVDRETQRSRDDSRRKILEDELATEEKGLLDAKSKLTEQESVRHGDEKNYQRVLDRLKPYQEAVERHERNVAALSARCRTSGRSRRRAAGRGNPRGGAMSAPRFPGSSSSPRQCPARRRPARRPRQFVRRAPARHQQPRARRPHLLHAVHRRAAAQRQVARGDRAAWGFWDRSSR